MQNTGLMIRYWSDKYTTPLNRQLGLHVIAPIEMAKFGGFQKMEREYAGTIQLSF